MLFREYRSKNAGVVVLRWGFLTYAIGITDQPNYQLINIRCTRIEFKKKKEDAPRYDVNHSEEYPFLGTYSACLK